MDPQEKSVPDSTECNCIQCQLTKIHRALVDLGDSLTREQQLKLVDIILPLGDLIIKSSRVDFVASQIQIIRSREQKGEHKS